MDWIWFKFFYQNFEWEFSIYVVYTGSLLPVVYSLPQDKIPVGKVIMKKRLELKHIQLRSLVGKVQNCNYSNYKIFCYFHEVEEIWLWIAIGNEEFIVASSFWFSAFKIQCSLAVSFKS